MRKKIDVVVGLVLVVLAVPVLVCDWMGPAKPPLRVGMSPDEVHAAIGDVPCLNSGTVSGNNYFLDEDYYSVDWLGNQTEIHVSFFNSEVTEVHTEPLPRTRPPWLDRALKAVGWD
jgi:hypothetical protein